MRTFKDKLHSTTIVATALVARLDYEIMRLEQLYRRSARVASFGQPAGKMMIGKWLANVKALRRITTEVVQHVPGQTIFNTFCHDLVTQVMPQIDY